MSAPAYSMDRFTRFMDRLTQHGLEAFRLYYGQYRGIVVDNVDDQHQGRILVRIPSIGDSPQVKRIAYPKVPMAGTGYGFKATPPVESIVWVTFENGRLDMPVWEGGIWLKDGIPESVRDPDTCAWFTPHGHKILLDGKSNQETVTVEHANGAKLSMDKDGNVFISNVSGKIVNVGLDASEAAILGDTLKRLLDELLDAIAAMTVGTGTGPSTIPINVVQFQAIKARLQTILSTTVKVK